MLAKSLSVISNPLASICEAAADDPTVEERLEGLMSKMDSDKFKGQVQELKG